MATEKINVPIETSYKGDAAKKALDDIKKIDSAKPSVTVTADTKTGGRDIDGLMKKVDKLDTESASILLASNASTIAQEIAGLILDLDKLDAEDPQVDIKAAEINALKGDLDQVTGKIKEINNVPVDIDTKPAQDGIKKLGTEADQSKSVMANMAGNASQDIAGLAGITGTAGVALGQLGEYATEGNISLSNLAKVAGPMLLLATGIEVASGILADMKAEAAATEARIKSFGAAMQSSADDTVGLADALRDDAAALRKFVVDASTFGDLIGQNLGIVAAKLPLIGDLFTDEGTDIIDIANRVGLSIYDIAGAAEGVGAPAWDDYRAAVDEAVRSGKISESEAEAIAAAVNTQARAVDGARDAQQLFNVDQAEANALLQQLLAQQAPLEHFTDQWKILFDDLADGTIDSKATADAINVLADKLGLTQEQVIALAQADLDGVMDEAATATEGAATAMFVLRDGQEAAKRSSERLGNQLDTLKGQLSFQQAALNFSQNFTTAMDNAKDGTALTAQEILDLKQDYITVAEYLGTNPAVIESNLNRIEEGDVAGVLWDTQVQINRHPDPSVSTTVKPPDNTGNMLQDYQMYLNGRPVRIPSRIMTAVASDRGGYVGAEGALVAERRPEFVRLPGAPQEILVTQPVLVPPGTQVTSGSETERILARRAAVGGDTTNVTIHLPRGARPDDWIRAGDKYARRNGRARAHRR